MQPPYHLIQTYIGSSMAPTITLTFRPSGGHRHQFAERRLQRFFP
ncbi:Uncharacterised protein [Serratia liquefaciens]|jgi:hypothetical protein|nr:hypothetical protein SFB10_0829 [Serratia liquefaciens]SUI71769.1 Uncharacterised protein [Serratia liquefaciens]